MARITVVNDYPEFLAVMQELVERAGDHEFAGFDGAESSYAEIAGTAPASRPSAAPTATTTSATCHESCPRAQAPARMAVPITWSRSAPHSLTGNVPFPGRVEKTPGQSSSASPHRGVAACLPNKKCPELGAGCSKGSKLPPNCWPEQKLYCTEIAANRAIFRAPNPTFRHC